MEEALLVNVEQWLCKLLGDVAYFILGKTLCALPTFSHQLVKIFFDVLEDEVGLIDYSNNLLELYYVGMIHLAKGFDLR